MAHEELVKRLGMEKDNSVDPPLCFIDEEMVTPDTYEAVCIYLSEYTGTQ